VPEIIIPDYDDLQVLELDFDEPAQVNRSAWTGTRKAVGLPGASLWTGRIAVENIATELSERPWRAFLTKIRGVQNWFKIYLPCQTHIGPAPTVASGAGNGYTLPLTGMTPSTTILEAGQHMSVPLPSGHVRTVRLTDDLVTNGSGNATAQFGPALNEIPTTGVTVETANPYVRMAATTPRNPLPQNNGISGFVLDVEESL
jgi:hypothetical protein